MVQVIKINSFTYHTQFPIVSTSTTDDRSRLRERCRRKEEVEDQGVEGVPLCLSSLARIAIL